MKRELTPQEVVYNLDFSSRNCNDDHEVLSEYDQVYKNIESLLNIKKSGYNLYLMDSVSKEKLNNILDYINGILKKKSKPKDICYVTNRDLRCPKPLFLSNGRGESFKEIVEEIKNSYFDKIFDFYNSSVNKEKEDILDEVQRKRNTYITDIVDLAKQDGFQLKATSSGFAFIPLKEEGEAMTEKEYDDLEVSNKDDIVNKAAKLKVIAEEVLEKLKDIELDSIEILKEIYLEYLNEELEELKNKISSDFKDESEALNFLNNMYYDIKDEIMEAYSMSYEDDEDKIGEILSRYAVNLLVNNKDREYPRAISEEDPSITNLIGTIEYESHNGAYSTDMSLINAGSLLLANEGCIVINASSLLSNNGSYYYLKKTLISQKLSYDYSRAYLEYISLNGLKPEPINIDVKVILIGDYSTFNALYQYDEDFKKIFRIKVEYNPYTSIDDNIKKSLCNLIKNIQQDNNLLPFSNSAINEIGKYLSRKAGSRKKILMDDFIVDKVLVLSNDIAEKKQIKEITEEEIKEVIYEEELIEKEVIESYKENKMMVKVRDSIIGSINGLSVIDTGYYSFGKPMRITCVCSRGSGKIVDIQKENNMSGSIHMKSISILRALMSKILDPYRRLPIDFQLSFEQTYGYLEGDSASVAETICMLSAMAKIPIKQSIGVTGSLNQFGEVQPIGGVNEKIEGFFNVCKAIDTIKGKAVLIPEINKDEITLNSEVEEAISRGDFKIYTMENINDAMEVMFDNVGTIEDILAKIENELETYFDK